MVTKGGKPRWRLNLFCNRALEIRINILTEKALPINQKWKKCKACLNIMTFFSLPPL